MPAAGFLGTLLTATAAARRDPTPTSGDQQRPESAEDTMPPRPPDPPEASQPGHLAEPTPTASSPPESARAEADEPAAPEPAAPATTPAETGPTGTGPGEPAPAEPITPLAREDAEDGTRRATPGTPGGSGSPDTGAPGLDVPGGVADDGPDGPLAEAEARAAAISTPQQPLGQPGRPLDHRSPFFVGMLGAAGVATTYLIAQIVVITQDVLVLIGVAWFLAVGLEPAVAWLVAHRLPRPLAVAGVLLAVLLLVGGFLAAVIPVLVSQASAFAAQLPHYLDRLRDHSSTLGRINDRFQVTERVQQALTGQSGGLVEGALGAGRAVLGALGDTLIVIVLTVYFLADLPRIRRGLYRLVPHSRRPRVILIGDEIFAKVGVYVLGNLLISVIAGALTFVWLLAFGVPYALLLALTVAVLDLIPVVGSTLAAVVVSLVALVVSLPIALATAGYFIVYRLAEDYLLVPKIIGRVVRVPALATVVAVLLGGVLLGAVGALVAIPVAAAILLVLREVAFPRLDRA